MDKIILIWLALINFVAFAMMGIDKWKAKRGSWRISEKALFFAALIGGGVGAFAGMQIFRHKIRHMKFVIGIPVITVLQILLIILLWL